MTFDFSLSQDPPGFYFHSPFERLLATDETLHFQTTPQRAITMSIFRPVLGEMELYEGSLAICPQTWGRARLYEDLHSQ